MKMNANFKIFLLLISIGLIIIAGCNKDDGGKTSSLQVPTVNTSAIFNIGQTSAVCGGYIMNEGGATITARGVCWNTGQNPSISDNKTTDGVGTGSFLSSITGLTANTTYYVRAYAINSAGTGYGETISFTTQPGVPVLTTTTITNITETTANCGGNISSDEGAPVTNRGVCWSTFQNPTIQDNRTSDGTGTGIFMSSITGLTANTTYYVRAYAINSAGTGYGETFLFTTQQEIVTTVTDIDGNVYQAVAIGSQVWMAENLRTTRYSDGSPIPLVTDNAEWSGYYTSGYCWYNNDQTTYGNTYGALYKWASIELNPCPEGWHVPSDDEWTTLTNYLGGHSVAGGKLKETGTTHWDSPNTDATNESGFTALPGGLRLRNGEFFNVRSEGIWWSSTEHTIEQAWIRSIFNNSGNLDRYPNFKNDGYSVRCVKDKD
ncbi:MAG: fibrobacter succinogenes major paralogous domain-containing protein [Paludibacteraceae bacterium]|nr:fibrobacter succinogenes major paralogous domain-containing protein [Paludibacteraceae bacterium]